MLLQASIFTYDIVKLKNEVIEFYDGKIVCKKGVFSKSETTTVFMGVYAVNIEQSYFGKIFNYGNVKVDAVGKWDINSTGIENPKELKAYLENFVKQTSQSTVKFVAG